MLPPVRTAAFDDLVPGPTGLPKGNLYPAFGSPCPNQGTAPIEPLRCVSVIKWQPTDRLSRGRVLQRDDAHKECLFVQRVHLTQFQPSQKCHCCCSVHLIPTVTQRSRSAPQCS